MSVMRWSWECVRFGTRLCSWVSGNRSSSPPAALTHNTSVHLLTHLSGKCGMRVWVTWLGPSESENGCSYPAPRPRSGTGTGGSELKGWGNSPQWARWFLQRGHQANAWLARVFPSVRAQAADKRTHHASRVLSVCDLPLSLIRTETEGDNLPVFVLFCFFSSSPSVTRKIRLNPPPTRDIPREGVAHCTNSIKICQPIKGKYLTEPLREITRRLPPLAVIQPL